MTHNVVFSSWWISAGGFHRQHSTGPQIWQVLKLKNKKPKPKPNNDNNNKTEYPKPQTSQTILKFLPLYSWETEKGLLLLTQYQVVSWVQKSAMVEWWWGNQTENHQFFWRFAFEATWNIPKWMYWPRHRWAHWPRLSCLPSSLLYTEALSTTVYWAAWPETLIETTACTASGCESSFMPQSLAHPHSIFPMWVLCFPRVNQLCLFPNPFMSVILTEDR